MRDIIFEYNGVTQSDALETYTKEKLERIFNRYDFVIRADVTFKTENTSSDETGMIAGIRLSAPGPRLYADSSKDEFQPAVSECVNELLRQLEKRKASMQTY